MSEPTELKPCPLPWCGENKMTVDDWQCVNGECWYECCTCLVEGPRCPTIEAAAKAWNHRPTETALVEALKEAGDVIESYHKNTGIDLGDASRMPFHSDTIKKIDAALKQAGVK